MDESPDDHLVNVPTSQPSYDEPDGFTIPSPPLLSSKHVSKFCVDRLTTEQCSSTPLRHNSLPSSSTHCSNSSVFQTPQTPDIILSGSIRTEPVPSIDLDSKEECLEREEDNESSALILLEYSQDSADSGYQSIPREYVDSIAEDAPEESSGASVSECQLVPYGDGQTWTNIGPRNVEIAQDDNLSLAQHNENPPSTVISFIDEENVRVSSSIVSSAPMTSSDRQNSYQNKLLKTVVNEYCPCGKERLIGCNIGLGRMDIISGLIEKNLYLCLSCIFKGLSQRDLVTFSHVCRRWRRAVKRDGRVRKIRHLYLQSCRQSKLQLGKENQSDEACKSSTDTRSAPSSSNVLTVAIRQPVAPPTVKPGKSSPTKLMTRHEQYVHFGNELINEEVLDKCPTCDGPAKVNPVELRGTCCRSMCGLEFCARCRCAFHGGESCFPRSPIKMGPSLVGSKVAKRHLRRL